MRKIFLRYFISIFALALAILSIQFGVLYFQYMHGQNKWMNSVYDDFVAAVKEAITNGSYADYGISSLLNTVSEIGDDRVSGFIVRNAQGDEMLTFGKTPEGRLLTSFTQSGNRASKFETTPTMVSRATRINLAVETDFNRVTSVDLIDVSEATNVTISLPSSFRDEGVIGSIIIAFNDQDMFIIDLLTFNPRTYQYSKDIINSCIKGLMMSVPVCIIIALIASYIISSRNAKYINGVRKALNDLSHGKSNVNIPHQKNSELNEISLAIEELDRDLQSNAKSRRAWLMSISHDLNTPTAAMKMIIDGMNDGVFKADEETLKELQKENDTLSDRIGKVIDFSSLQADTIAEIAEISSSQFISDVLMGFDRAQEVRASAECETIECDPVLMTKAAKELLKNAVEFNAQADMPVRWTIRKNDGFYEMVIANVGTLNAEMGSDFFEPWARGDWSRTNGGSGLGLPIAASIASLHKGEMSLKQVGSDMVQAMVRWPAQPAKL